MNMIRIGEGARHSHNGPIKYSAKRRAVLLTLMMFTALPGHGVSYAQTSDEVEEKTERIMETIIVTARKREESLLDVPISLSVVTGDELRRAGAFRVQDIAQLVPNMKFTPDQVDDGDITIRGISSNDEAGFDSSVGVYVDGVYVARAAAFNGLLVDVERIEVLRGPQGTLFGKNSIAGAINIISKKPSDEFEARADFNYGNYDYKQVRASAGGTIAEGLNARAALLYRDRDGYFKNRIGKDGDDDNSLGGAIHLFWEPTESLDVLVSADAVRDRTLGGRQDVYLDDSNNSQFFPIDDTFGEIDREGSFDETGASFNDRDMWGVSLKADLDVGGYTFTSVSSYRDLNLDARDDEDQTELDILLLTVDEHTKQFSQEVRVTSPGDQRFTWLAGAFFFTQDIDDHKTGTLTALPALFGFPSFAPEVFATVEETSYAFFGQAGFDITDRLNITAGVRYSVEDKDLSYFQPVPGSPHPFGSTLGPVTDSAENDEVTPSASVNYKFSDSVNSYFTYSNGFKGAGFNTFFLVDPDNLSFSPEFVDNYEVGLKTQLFDRRIDLNIAAFYMDYSDLQVRSLVNGNFLTQNVASASLKGVEAEAAAWVNDHLNISAGVGFLDAKLEEYTDGSGNDLSGNRVPDAARWQANLVANYTQPLTNSLELVFRGAVHYSSKYFNDTANNPLAATDDYTLVNARLGVRGGDGRWEVNLWANNITDAEYITSTNNLGSFGGFQTAGLNPPRTFGVELRVSN